MMGSIIPVAAALLIHMLRKAVVDINASRIL